MRSFLPILFLVPAFAQTWVLENSGSSASLRGVSVVDANIAWASGSGGTFLRTVDGGKTWTHSVVPGAETLDFRGIHAFTAERAILMSSGEGAKSTLYETEDAGHTWTLLFPNPDPKGFFDSLAFADPAHGALLGDPVSGSFALFLTADQGRHWARATLPPALPGEGAFAASNSSLAIRKCKHGKRCEIFFATGGIGAARVFHSRDSVHWNVIPTPLRNDAAGAGIFSVALDSKTQLVAAGGDYAKPRESAHAIALSANAAVPRPQWTEPSGARPRGYRSSVVFLQDPGVWITTGPNGSEVSRDNSQSWTPFDDGSFNAIGGHSAQACWAVGPQGRIARLKL